MVKVRKGFTLVELLIVIVIIGILAAAMLLSSGSATAAAEASNIISDLRSMKAAALMLYADSMDEFNVTPPPTLDVSMLQRYVDNPKKYGTGTLYTLSSTGNATDGYKWWVGYTLSGATKEVKEKLAGKAKSVGLLGDKDLTVPFVETSSAVYMVAR